MNQERYQQINALVEAALQLDRSRRRDFLHRACGSDQDLLERVDALLDGHESAVDFLEKPALDSWARDVAQAASMKSLIGRQVGRYLISSHLGSGGIGEVWLANDTELSRDVALKFLSPEVAHNSDQVRRFRQEARAASSLNHPNLVTIFDIGEFDGRQFIAQEFIRGKTIRESLRAGPFNVDQVIEIAAQIAGGLRAAHEAGVVHRDIKPENIMIRPDGVVKVLDFGIARLAEQESSIKNKPSRGLTQTGIILGTARYMSPEQARGLPVDGRSDIFSLGAVLYEMLTGAATFQGETPSDILAAILTYEPPALSGDARRVPAAFERIARKCIAKDPAGRYSTAAGLQEALKTLGAKNGRVIPLRALWIGGAIAVTILAATVFGLLMRSRHEPATSFNSMNISRLATRGEVSDVTIARDGSLLAYVVPDKVGQRIWIRNTSSSDEKTLGVEGTQLSNITFSPDNSFLYYRRKGQGESDDLYRVPAKGGTPRRVIGDVSGAAAISPDGNHLAFIRLKPSTWEASLVVSDSEGGNESILQTLRRPQFFDEHSLAWSPHSDAVACFAGEGATIRLVEISIRHPAQRLISPQSWIWPQSIAWSTRGDVLVVTAATPGDIDQLWAVRHETGEVTRLTNDLSGYGRIAMTDDGESLVAIHRESALALWATAGRDNLHFDRITTSPLSSTRVEAGWTPDDRVVYSDPADGFRNLWIMEASGANPRRLTSSAGNKDEFVVTHDGRYIVFEQDYHIWRVNNDGSNPRQLTYGAFDVHPDVSPNGKTVVYASFADWTPGVGGEPTLWSVPIDGGEAVQVSRQPTSVPRISPDGNQIACIHYPGRDPRYSRRLLAVMNSDGNGPFTVFQNSPSDRTQLSWSPDGQALDYVVNANGIGNLWRQSLKGGQPEQVTHFDSDELFDFSWSHDGRLLCTRGSTSRTAVLIRNFR